MINWLEIASHFVPRNDELTRGFLASAGCHLTAMPHPNNHTTVLATEPADRSGRLQAVAAQAAGKFLQGCDPRLLGLLTPLLQCFA